MSHDEERQTEPCQFLTRPRLKVEFMNGCAKHGFNPSALYRACQEQWVRKWAEEDAKERVA